MSRPDLIIEMLLRAAFVLHASLARNLLGHVKPEQNIEQFRYTEIMESLEPFKDQAIQGGVYLLLCKGVVNKSWSRPPRGPVGGGPLAEGPRGGGRPPRGPVGRGRPPRGLGREEGGEGGSPKRLHRAPTDNTKPRQYKAPTDNTRPQQTIQSLNRQYKDPTDYTKPPKHYTNT